MQGAPERVNVGASVDGSWVKCLLRRHVVHGAIRKHANDVLVISASGDWHCAVPKGMVGVTATIQGSREPGSKHQHFLVPKAEYDTREKNPGGIFVIDPARYQTWDPEREVTS